MSDSRNKDRINERLYEVDSWLNSTVYGLWSWIGRIWGGYAAMLGRLRIRGVPRLATEIISDGATLGMIFLVVLHRYGLPDFDGSGDVWNQGRKVAVTFTDSSGQIIGRRGVRQDDAIPLDQIPPKVIQAVLATEDRRFFDHFGLDFQGTLRATVENVRARDVVQGGSTITQQLAKNLFLTPDRTFERKLHEAFLALWIEARLSKEQILKLYLDRAYLGGGTYGVEAAAQYYFNKSIRDVSLPEAAMLAGLFKAPSKYAPHVDIKAAHARANVVLESMLASDFISEGEAFAARREPAEFVKREGFETPNYYLDFAYVEVQELIKSYKLAGEFNLEVSTTIDLRLQKIAQATVNNMIDVNKKSANVSEAALVSMTPQGAVKVVVGGRDYDSSQFNRATDAKRQPGSSFKPFVYLAALRSGMRPTTVLSDSPITLGNWSPKNYTRTYRGPVTLLTALQKSINTIPVHIAQIIGRRKIQETAQLVGLQSKVALNRSMPLGTGEVTLMDLTGAYSTFANGGTANRPHAVLEIRRPDGTVLYNRERNAAQSLRTVNPVYVGDLNYMLNQVVLGGTGRRAFLKTTPVAGKTGTTQGYRDAWFVGYTARHVTGVWFGNDDFTPMRRVTGGRLPAQAWHDFMANAERGESPEPLPGVTVTSQYQEVDEQFDETTELALLEASSRDPVVKVLYNMAGLFKNAESKTSSESTYNSFDSYAEFRGNSDDNRYRTKRRRSAPPKKIIRDIWNAPVGSGGYR